MRSAHSRRWVEAQGAASAQPSPAHISGEPGSQASSLTWEEAIPVKRIACEPRVPRLPPRIPAREVERQQTEVGSGRGGHVDDNDPRPASDRAATGVSRDSEVSLAAQTGHVAVLSERE